MYGLLDYVYTHPPPPPSPDKKNGAPFPSFFFCRWFEGRLRLYVGHGLRDTCTFRTSTHLLHVVNFGGFEWLYLVQYRPGKHQT